MSAVAGKPSSYKERGNVRTAEGFWSESPKWKEGNESHRDDDEQGTYEGPNDQSWDRQPEPKGSSYKGSGKGKQFKGGKGKGSPRSDPTDRVIPILHPTPKIAAHPKGTASAAARGSEDWTPTLRDHRDKKPLTEEERRVDQEYEADRQRLLKKLDE